MSATRSARGVGAVVGVVAAIVFTAVPPALGARTLAVSPTRIEAFAQDGRFIAWMARVPHTAFPTCGPPIIRNLSTGRQRSFGGQFPSFCSVMLALGRGRALWTTEPIICGNCHGASLWTGALGDPRVVHLGGFAADPDGFGDQLTGAAGDGPLLAFSWVGYRPVDETCMPCMWDVTRGRALRVVGHSRLSVPGVAPPALLAAAAGRLAIAPANDPWTGPERPQPAKDGPVNVIDAETGALVMSVSPLGRVRRLALSGRALAILLKRADGSRAIERYAIPSGTLLASTPVAENASFGTLDISYKWIVYRVGHKIRIVDALGSDHLLLKTLTRPIGLSIEGRRVAWAENSGGLHRIRAALAPG